MEQLTIIAIIGGMALLGFAIVSDFTGRTWGRYLAFVGLSGSGLLVALMRVEARSGLVWSFVAIGCAIGLATNLERLTNTTVKEQRLWRFMFGETFWQLLMNDSRLSKK